jgi:hypothetical protein
LNLPLGQVKHAGKPASSAKVPKEHTEQLASLVAALSWPNFPTGHFEHELEPRVVEYRPGAQGSQSELEAPNVGLK